MLDFFSVKSYNIDNYSRERRDKKEHIWSRNQQNLLSGDGELIDSKTEIRRFYSMKRKALLAKALAFALAVSVVAPGAVNVNAAVIVTRTQVSGTETKDTWSPELGSVSVGGESYWLMPLRQQVWLIWQPAELHWKQKQVPLYM